MPLFNLFSKTWLSRWRISIYFELLFQFNIGNFNLFPEIFNLFSRNSLIPIQVFNLLEDKDFNLPGNFNLLRPATKISTLSTGDQDFNLLQLEIKISIYFDWLDLEFRRTKFQYTSIGDQCFNLLRLGVEVNWNPEK